MQADRLATDATGTSTHYQDGSTMIKFAPTHPAEPIRTHPAILANIQLERRTSEPPLASRLISAARVPALAPHPNSISEQFDFGLHNDLGVRSASQEVSAVASANHLRLAFASAPLEGLGAKWSLPSTHNAGHLEQLHEEHGEKSSAATHVVAGSSPAALDRLLTKRRFTDELEYGRDNEPSAVKPLEELKCEFERFLKTHLEPQQDRLELAVYLNEYETNACDLSELLTNILRNLFVPDKLKRPAIKCKLLHYIKRLYIEPRLANESDAGLPLLSGGGSGGVSGDYSARVTAPAGPSLSSSSSLDHERPQLELPCQLMSAAGKFELDLKLFNAMIRRYQLANQVVQADESMLFGVGSMSGDLASRRSRQLDNATDSDELTTDNHDSLCGAILRNLEPPLPKQLTGDVHDDRDDLGRLLISSAGARSAQNQFERPAQSSYSSYTLNGFSRRQNIDKLDGTIGSGCWLDQNIANRNLEPHFIQEHFGLVSEAEAFKFEHNHTQQLFAQELMRQEQQQQQQKQLQRQIGSKLEPRGSQSNEFEANCDDEWVSARELPKQSDIMRTSAYSASLDSLHNQLAGSLEASSRDFGPTTSAAGDFMIPSSRARHLIREPEVMSPPPAALINAADEFEYPIQANSYNPDELLARLSTPPPPDFHSDSMSRFHANDNETTPLSGRKHQYGSTTFHRQQSCCDCAGCLESATANANAFQHQRAANFAPLNLRPAEWAPARHTSLSSTQRCHSSMSIPFEPGGRLQANQVDWTSMAAPRPPPQPSSGQLLNYDGQLGATVASNYQNNNNNTANPNWVQPLMQPHSNAWIAGAYNEAGQQAPSLSHCANGAAWSLPGSPNLMKQRADWRHFSAFNEAPVGAADPVEINQLGAELHWPPENYRQQQQQQQELRPTSVGASKPMGNSHQIRLIELGGGQASSTTTQSARRRAHEPNQARREHQQRQHQQPRQRRSRQSARLRQDQGYGNSVGDEKRSNSIEFGPVELEERLAHELLLDHDHHDDDDDDDCADAQLLVDGPSESLALVPSQAKGRLPMSVAEQMSEQATKFVQHYGSAASAHRSSLTGSLSAALPTNQSATKGGHHRQGATRASSSSGTNQLQVRRTLRVKIRKSKPILGIAIEGGFNVSGQLLPRIVCVHEEGAAYQCGKLRASDLILEVNGIATANMTHDEIAETIANAYYQDERPYIEFLIGESVHV